ncbi:amino acid adenylation domain-containing protein [Paenibacillus sp. N4]|uniref:non-ribosomal peptide synthetase n=1 Tax=Paenibacillus vietnamensis TaxID=2590547 RepID=UPI001CD06BAE|nr:non-ribosomal peptide synthetase [Paenibacillus vietnamensis]MCA0756969.1 amino acid adenylation domain-containing protein [Paenibacillus vietnamensis]
MNEQHQQYYVFPASDVQQSQWFFREMAPDSPLYNLPYLIRMQGALDRNALEKSLQAVVDRHEALRTSFRMEQDQLVQVIALERSISLPVSRIDPSTRMDQESWIQAWALAESSRLFDLQNGPLLRVHLLEVSQDEHFLAITMHHSITDGWSMAVLIKEWQAFYRHLVEDQPLGLAELSLQYADFTEWQRERYESGKWAEQLAYWKRQLQGSPATLSLPTDKPRPPVQAYQGASYSFSISPELKEAAAGFSREEGVTLFMTLFAAYQTLLYRYSGQDDLVVGTPIAGRNQAGMENLIGFVANTLALRSRIGEGWSFRQLVEHIRQVTLDAYDRQEVPFDKVVDELQLERSAAHSPLFQVMFVLQNIPVTAWELPGVTCTPVSLHNRTAKFDLTLTIAEEADGLTGFFEYNTDLYREETIRRMAGHFERLLQHGIEAPDQLLTRLQMVTIEETAQEAAQMKQNKRDFDTEHAIHQLFEKRAARTPHAAAVVFEEKSYTYQELNERANQLAHELVQRGIGANSLVGICMERSLELIVAIIGVLKAGGAYVPLDPKIPSDRLQFILEDSQVKALLTQSEVSQSWPSLTVTPIHLDTDWEPVSRQSKDNLELPASALQLAYVIYTSGTTGKPKGVLVNHGNVTRLFAATEAWYRFTGRDVWTLYHSYAFDFSVWEIWGALLYGGKLVIVPFWISRSPEDYYRLLEQEQVTVLNQTPSAFRQLIAMVGTAPAGRKLTSLRYVIFGGEALDLQGLRPWFERYGDQTPQLVNMYGITETTVHVTYRPIASADLEEGKGNVIGIPIPDLQVYVLDRHLQPVPKGVVGEMYVGGAGVAPGYLRRPELTSERFITNEAGERLYKTGDLARYLPSGELEYHGRMDHQVKIRGFRIELGEIESVLGQYPGIREAAAAVKEDRQAGNRIIAYVVGEKAGLSGGKDDLRRYLQERLPDYMIPAAFVEVSAIPLNHNGKVDYSALPAPDFTNVPGNYAAPRTELEKKLAAIWEQVLQVQPIGADDNFFEAGGDSILSIRILGEVRKLGYSLTVQDLFRFQTIRELAPVIESSKRMEDRLSVTAPFQLITEEDRTRLPSGVIDAYPLTKLQEGMLFHSSYQQDSMTYLNVSSYHLKAPFHRQAWEQAIASLMNDHSVLRTSFDLTGYTGPLQLVHEEVELPFEVTDLRHLSSSQQEQWLADWKEKKETASFDWTKAPLFKIVIHLRSEETFQFTCIEHHAILDGWSVASLFDEVFRLYVTFINHKVKTGQAPQAEFRDYVAMEEEALRCEEHRRFWKEQVSAHPFHELPRWHKAKTEQRHQIREQGVEIPLAISDSVKQLANRLKVPLKSILLAAHFRVLQMASGQPEVISGVPFNGRTEGHDGERTLGLFLNALPFGVAMSGGTWTELIHQIFEQEQSYLRYRRYPLAQIQQDSGGSPLYEVIFNYTNFHILDSLQDLDDFHVLEFSERTYNNFAMSVEFRLDRSDHLQLLLQWDEAQFCEEQMALISGYYRKALESVVQAPMARYEDQDLLTEVEKSRILTVFNPPESEDESAVLRSRTIHQWFDEQAAKTPDQIAVVYEGKQLTYRELNEEANRLAHRLRAKGVGRESIVGIMVERSIEMAVGTLAILKAGGTYLPIDPGYPAERIEYVLEDSRASLLLTKQEWIGRFHYSGEVIDLCDPSGETNDPQSLPHVNDPSDLAYIIYTSGSTGKPKGVMVEHRNVLRLVIHQDFIDFNPGYRLLMTGNFAFDISTLEIWGPLLNGLTLYLLSKEKLLDPEQIERELADHQIDIVHLVSPLFSQLSQGNPEMFSTVRTLLVGGDVVSASHVNLVRKHCPKLKVIHSYGPTENTTFSTTYLVNRDFDSTLPIGKPLRHSTAYVVDPKTELLRPVGVPGELWVGGEGVARGYFNQPEMTKEKFIESPFQTGEKIYKTGDQARWLFDGTLEFLGRIDQQVKIRGYRVELSEIEYCLLQLDKVKEAVVIAREDQQDKYLCAYVIGSEPLSVSDLREHAAESLPDFMIPSYFIQLEQIPLTAHGKVDRKQLPAPQAGGYLEQEPTAPRNEWETKLAAVWQEVLGLERISVRESFFALGGHSLKATILVSKLRKELQVEIEIKHIFTYQTVEKLAQFLMQAEVRQHRSIPAVEPQEYYPASSAQRRMFTLDKIVENKRLYNIPIAVRITGQLDRQRFRESWQTLVGRHEALRTGFGLVNGEVMQKVHPAVPFTVDFIPVSSEADENFWLHQLVNKTFSLEQAPLFQATVLERTAMDFVLVMNMHHIISDETSIGVILRELMAVYEGRPLPEPNIQYKDYAAWHNRLLQSEAMKQQESYWVSQFTDEVPVLQLPTDFVRPAVQQFDGDSVSFAADPSVMTDLRKLTQYTGTTNYMVLLAAFNVLVAKYSRQEDVIVGTPIAGRTHADVENMVGMLVNTLAIRTKPCSDKTFLQYVGEVKSKALEAYSHQDYPFDYLVDHLKVKRDLSRNPLFDVMFSMEYPDIPQSGSEEIRFEPYETPYPLAKFDLSLYAQETDEQLRFTFQYAAGLFTKETIELMAVHYLRILQSVIAQPEKSLASIPMVTDREKQQILFELNETEAAAPADRTIHQLFEEQVRRTPNQIAVVHRETSLTYHQVNERANQLAWQLRHEGVTANTIVGLMVERSVEVIVGILGILKAGGAYVPVDPELPPKRVSYLLNNSGAHVLVTQSGLPDQIDYKGKRIDIHDSALSKQPTTNPESGNQPDDLMYVIYTSGSTGNPKGVMIEHRSMVNYVTWFTEMAKLTADDRTILLSSYAFDLGYTSLYSSLLNGCVLHIADKDLVRVPEALLAYLGDYQISFIKGTPSLFRMMRHASPDQWRKACETLRLVVLGGESMNAEEMRSFLQTYPHVQVMNHYGPTETCVGAMAGFVDPEQLADRINVPVGTPIHNNKIYILDSEFQVVPAGVTGELFISGAGLARGYLYRPELTEERFLTNPFVEGERLYRTGDIVRLLPDRRVEFLGRADHQVKIRGYRVELEEIESHLLLHPSIHQAAVICKDNQSLIAYIVTAEELTLTALRDYLADKVPDYMIPAQFAVLDRIPLTPNGKVDRRALPEAEGLAWEARHTTPLDQIEQDLVRIWEQVLGIKGVGTQDNFFDIGGNSLSLIRLHSLIEPLYAGVTVINLFAYPSISKLAAYIRQTIYQDQKSEVRAIPYPEDFFAADKGLKGVLHFTIEDEWFASIGDAAESMQLHLSEFMLALFLYLQAELTEQEQITIPAITDWNGKIHFVTIDLRKIEKLPDLFRIVQDQVKEAASPNDPLIDPASMQIVKDEHELLPGFMRKSASASEMTFAEKCDLLLVLHEHPTHLYVECMYNARLNKAKILEMMQQYVQIIQSLAEQLEPSKG